MSNNLTTNKVTLTGVIVSKPVLSHEIYGESFYELILRVSRLSDSSDLIPITISERLIDELCLEIDSSISIVGQFRSYNKIVDDKSRLMLTVFVKQVLPVNNVIPPNSIELSGFVCKSPIYRTTPFNREICDILLAVNRAYNKSDYIPCIAWGRNARFTRHLSIGEKVIVYGRIQSRNYTKKVDETTQINKTAYEVSISKVLAGEYAEQAILENVSDGYTEEIIMENIAATLV